MKFVLNKSEHPELALYSTLKRKQMSVNEISTVAEGLGGLGGL